MHLREDQIQRSILVDVHEVVAVDILDGADVVPRPGHGLGICRGLKPREPSDAALRYGQGDITPPISIHVACTDAASRRPWTDLEPDPRTVDRIGRLSQPVPVLHDVRTTVAIDVGD